MYKEVKSLNNIKQNENENNIYKHNELKLNNNEEIYKHNELKLNNNEEDSKLNRQIPKLFVKNIDNLWKNL